MREKFDVNSFVDKLHVNCRITDIKEFQAGEVITTFLQKRNQFCILLNGNADLVRYDFNGNRTIVEHLTENDIFGEVFYTVTTNNELLVEARQKCEVLIYSYDNIHFKCKNNCKFHSQLSEFLPELILNKITDLNMRVELLTKRTIRDKLLGYFSLLSTRKLSKSFKIPFSLTDLADYLSIDRSAMMRELKLLKDDGFIDKNGNTITLLY